MTTPRPKILCVANDYPWPENTGFRMRLSNTVRALAELGDVDLFVAVNDDRAPEGRPKPDDVVVARIEVVNEDSPKSKAVRLLRWTFGRRPLELLWRRWSRARRVFRRWRRDDYDLVWYSQVDGQVALGDLVSAPIIVDFDNLNDYRLLHRGAARAADAEAGRAVGVRTSFAHRFARRFLDPRDVHRWARIQRELLEQAELVVVCSELDRGRLDHPKAHVVPNGYEVPAHRLDRRDRPPAVMTFVGGLWYEPNSDAAWWFATKVLPVVARSTPEARFHVVGRPDAKVDGLGDCPGVVLRGGVPDVVPELAVTSVSVVPLRSGGGTRLKILEAFAYGIPVVSTTVGCEGLGVRHGEHLLVADDAEAFAQACVRLLEEPELVEHLVDAAFELVEGRFAWSILRPRITELARRVALDART